MYGHIIYWVVVCPDDDIHGKSPATDSLNLDYHCIKSYFKDTFSKFATTYITVSNMANIDCPTFITELSSVSEFSSVEKANHFGEVIRSVLDNYEPTYLRKVRNHNSTPQC